MNKIIIALIVMIGFASADVKKEFYKNGSLKYKITYEADKKTGCKIKMYYANGALKKEFSFSNNDNKQCDTIKFD